MHDIKKSKVQTQIIFSNETYRGGKSAQIYWPQECIFCVKISKCPSNFFCCLMHLRKELGMKK